jgi:hypothetical protein
VREREREVSRLGRAAAADARAVWLVQAATSGTKTVDVLRYLERPIDKLLLVTSGVRGFALHHPETGECLQHCVYNKGAVTTAAALQRSKGALLALRVQQGRE